MPSNHSPSNHSLRAAHEAMRATLQRACCGRGLRAASRASANRLSAALKAELGQLREEHRLLAAGAVPAAVLAGDYVTRLHRAP